MKNEEPENNPNSSVISNLNERHPKFSPDWLRTFKGCEHYTDEEAIAAIESLFVLGNILMENADKKLQQADKQRIIPLYPHPQYQKRTA